MTDYLEAFLGNQDDGPLNGSQPEGEEAKAASPEDDLFRLWAPGELLDADRTFKWLVRGLLVSPTYGMVAGEKKTLKSYIAMFINLAVASGTPLFGQFEVDEAMPVVTYVGEGGRIPYTLRLERVAHAMGVKLRDLPLHSSFDVAAVQSPRFAETLTRDLRDRKPGLITLDPLYAFHGAAANASNLHEEGALLSSMSTPCINAGTSLQVVNHFNKTGGGRGLDRITQSGGQEWADTWLLLSHRSAPDVTNGEFKLLLEVGSRQWGGSEWDLDMNLGPFDVELGEFDGDISWELHRHRDPIGDSLEAKVVKLITAHPFQLTKEELAKGIGGNLQFARTFIADLEAKGAIGIRKVTRERSDGKKLPVWAYHLEQPSSDPGRCETEADQECA